MGSGILRCGAANGPCLLPALWSWAAHSRPGQLTVGLGIHAHSQELGVMTIIIKSISTNERTCPSHRCCVDTRKFKTIIILAKNLNLFIYYSFTYVFITTSGIKPRTSTTELHSQPSFYFFFRNRVSVCFLGCS